MVKSLVGKIGTLALFSAFAGGALAACSSEIDTKQARTSSEGTEGSVGLNLVPVSGVTLNSVNYVVTGTPAIAGTPLPSGVLPTPGTSDNFSFGIPVPVGTGYTLSLTASSAEVGDDVTCTGSFGPFAVTANTSSNFSLTLTCVDNSNGQLIGTVGVVTTDCPRLIPTYVSAIPSTAAIGGSIAVNALGSDLDGKPVTYSWSVAAANAGVGTFAGPTLQSTTFTCAAPGNMIPVTVTMDNGECDKTLDTTISCTSVTCGNGVLNTGEDCDPAIAAGAPGGGAFGCPADCTVVCGDGSVELPAEQCEIVGGVPTGACTAQCRNRVQACGDAFITGTEVCDGVIGVPAGSTCAADCLTINGPAPTVCGDNAVTGTEECELPNTFTCSDNCQSVATTACADCEQNGACFEFSNSCIDNTTNAADRASCFDVQECISDSNCADGANTLTSCFCGTLGTSACIAAPLTGPGSPAGACAGVIRTAMGGAATTNAQVLTRFTNIAFPGGAAIARYNCTKLDPGCTATCGF